MHHEGQRSKWEKENRPKTGGEQEGIPVTVMTLFRQKRYITTKELEVMKNEVKKQDLGSYTLKQFLNSIKLVLDKVGKPHRK